MKPFTIEMQIAKIRKEKSVSLKLLEEETGIERHYLKRIEEELPADEILFSEAIVIARALEVETEDLFDIKELEMK